MHCNACTHACGAQRVCMAALHACRPVWHGMACMRGRMARCVHDPCTPVDLLCKAAWNMLRACVSIYAPATHYSSAALYLHKSHLLCPPSPPIAVATALRNPTADCNARCPVHDCGERARPFCTRMAQRAFTTDKPVLWQMHARHQAAAFCTLAVPHGVLLRARCHHLLNYYSQCGYAYG